MPDLLPGLRKAYGTSAPSYLGETGVTLRFLLLLVWPRDGLRVGLLLSLCRVDAGLGVGVGVGVSPGAGAGEEEDLRRRARAREDLNRPMSKTVLRSDSLL